jgi:ribonuclease P protein component
VLPASARLTHRAEFASTIRRGRRAGRSRLVVHLHVAGTDPSTAHTPRAGFVVSKAVGNAVVRHRVSRRLRHLVADRLDALAPGSSLVVRALPPSAQATSAELARDLDSALAAARRPRTPR